MTLFDELDAAYQRLTGRPRPAWLTTVTKTDLPGLVATIRDDRDHDPRIQRTADTALRDLIGVGRSESDALTVALYALAPRLRAGLGRAITDDYRDEVLTDLALVLLDSPLHGPGLARLLLRRAHSRTRRAARRAHTRGTRNVRTTAPRDPATLALERDPGDDVATIVARRVDLDRFATAVRAALGAGQLSEAAWTVYREHRLRRAVDTVERHSTSHERSTATRAARQLEPLITTYLHAA